MKIACVQMTTACDPADNLPVIAARVKAAAKAGAALVALPETCTFMEAGRAAMRARLETQADSQTLVALQQIAKAENIALLIGSMILAAEGNELADEPADEKAVNRSLLLAPDGALLAHYDKIHMFDVALGNGERHHESAAYQAGDRLALAAWGGATLGLTICYDLRFPTVYRRLAEAGAQVIFVPSAFTRQTGEAHWHVLLRARAIETGCYIVAPAQIGTHENGRETYGHSLIIDPWGAIIAEAGADDEIISAEIDVDRVTQARAQIPALLHASTYQQPDGGQAHD